MKQQLLHTPEGVRDIYNIECEQKLQLEADMMSVFRMYGYHPIQTPTFEFFDIFGKQIGSTSAKDLYKFFDKEGNTLVLRPDITPSIARSASKYFMDEASPIRLCYVGNTFINNQNYQGRLKECTQAGAELLGDSSVDADAEIIALAIDSLKTAGLREFQISVGHVDYLGGLFDAAGMDETTETKVKELINNKNFYGVDEIVSKLDLSKELLELFHMLHFYAITPEALKHTKDLAKAYPRVLSALNHMEALYHILKIYGIEQYVSFELAMLSGLEYYTGMIFAGYTYGTGESIVKGGRYDQLLNYFGKNSAATGFVIVIDQLMAALARQNIQIPVKRNITWIVYEQERLDIAIAKAMELRAQGIAVELMKVTQDMSKQMYEVSAQNQQIKDVIYI